MLQKILTPALISVLALSAGAALADSHKDKSKDTSREVLVILASESNQTQGMAMVLSNTMASQGAQVNVLLCDKAGDLALRNYEAPALKPKDVTPGQMLRSLIKQGAAVNVCALYLPNSEHSQADLIEGVGVATPPDMAGQMLNPKIRTFSF